MIHTWEHSNRILEDLFTAYLVEHPGAMIDTEISLTEFLKWSHEKAQEEIAEAK